VRASNTAAELTLRFEGDTEEVIEQLKLLFKRELSKVAPKLDLNF
jgi:phosphomannomutase/phosphoglucomutase